MKGNTKVTIKGKDYKLSFTLGVLEDFQEHLKEEKYKGGIQEAFSEFKYLRKLISLMADYADNPVDINDVKRMEFSEISKVTELIAQAMENVESGNQKAKTGK